MVGESKEGISDGYSLTKGGGGDGINVQDGTKNDRLQRVSSNGDNRGIVECGKVLVNQVVSGRSSYGDGLKSLELRTQNGGLWAVEGLMFFIRHTILMALFFCISIYRNVEYVYRRIFLRFLSLAYYPNKTPQLIRDDVNKLSKIPKRLSCILDLKDEKEENGGIDGLISSISEITAWTILAGIPVLSIYEFHGVINDHLPELCRYIQKNLAVYFGTESLPVFSLKVPHSGTVIYSSSFGSLNSTPPGHIDLEISLLSRVDGKPTIVELTKTMCELASNKELSVEDITINLVDEELVELVGPEPDLLISFGPVLDLEDYPPWHIRLTEFYWEPDNRDTNYAVFIRALRKYSTCKVNLGK